MRACADPTHSQAPRSANVSHAHGVALGIRLLEVQTLVEVLGLIGDGTTATINRVEVCIIKEGDEVCWICPNDPEFAPELGAHEATDEENSPPVMTVTIEGVTYSCESPPRKKRRAEMAPGAPKKLKPLNV